MKKIIGTIIFASLLLSSMQLAGAIDIVNRYGDNDAGSDTLNGLIDFDDNLEIKLKSSKYEICPYQVELKQKIKGTISNDRNIYTSPTFGTDVAVMVFEARSSQVAEISAHQLLTQSHLYNAIVSDVVSIPDSKSL